MTNGARRNRHRGIGVEGAMFARRIENERTSCGENYRERITENYLYTRQLEDGKVGNVNSPRAR